MPRVNLGRPDYEKIFGAKLKSVIIERRMKCTDVAKRMGCTDRTLSNRFSRPSDMTLGQLKLYIKATGIEEDAIIQYLYERKANER